MSRVQRALAAVERRAGQAPADAPDRSVLARAVLTVTFHPDRPARDGRTAAEALADDGVYRTQFETGVSSGGLDEVLAGARRRWEQAMFDGAYDDASPAERPRYGGLDLLPHPDGACPRFGSTHLRLRPHVLSRATFSWGDSVLLPTAVGTWDRIEPVLAAAAAADDPELAGRRRPGPERLDHYVEAQVHGGLHLSDVEAVVTDPSYRGTAVERHLAAACERYGAALRWHDGYALPLDALDEAFRGPEPVRLARTACERLGGDVLDPALLGRAAVSILADPGTWHDEGAVTALQHLKYLWHHLAAFGYRIDRTPRS